MPAIQTAPFGSWRSPITSDLIVADSISIQDVLLDGSAVYWIEGRPREAGRYVLVRAGGGPTSEDVTPAPFNVRSRVHEYGGGAAVVHGGQAYFSHFADQRLYHLAPGQAPRALTPAGASGRPGLRYADGLIDPGRNRWVGVREDHRSKGEPMNTLVGIDLATGGEGEVLFQDSDFYSSPRLAPDGKKLAWLSWDHPNMPWVGTVLWLADVLPGGQLVNPAPVAGGLRESVFQPEWSPDGILYFISDRSGWWNLYRAERGQVRPVCPRDADFGRAQWTFGMSTYGFCSPDRIVCTWTEKGLGKLAVLEAATGKLTPLEVPFSEFGSIRVQGQQVVFRAGSPAEPPCVVRLDVGSGRHEVLRTSSSVASRPDVRACFSTPQPIEFPTENGLTAHGLYYPPHNPAYTGPAGERPPLVVKCHGGPTSAASSTLDLRIQFWTSRGIAVLDVNYGGSTGYGRAYRERLEGQWGVVDVDDCINGAKYLAGEGLIDPERAVITGGSAGGFTTLAALAFRDFFKGGASHYGVSDLEALVRDTHKFESRYLDSLVGEYPAQKELYEQRSPVHSADRVKVPVVFFQGDEDEIVPPNQTEIMVEALRRNGLPVGYLLFEGEQHGFRAAQNIKLALDAELFFYAALVFRAGLAFPRAVSG